MDKIVDLSGRHTLTVELLARTTQVAAMSVKALHDTLVDKGFNLNEAIGERVGTFWRNEKEKKPIFNHLLKIFDLSGVTESERHLLTNLAVLPAVYIPIDEISVSGLNLLKPSKNSEHLILFQLIISVT